MKQIRIKSEVLASHKASFYKLAKHTGLSLNTIKSIAQGKQRRIDFEVLEKIADYLNISPLELLGEEHDDFNK